MTFAILNEIVLKKCVYVIRIQDFSFSELCSNPGQSKVRNVPIFYHEVSISISNAYTHDMQKRERERERETEGEGERERERERERVFYYLYYI